MFKWLSKILGAGEPTAVMEKVFTEPTKVQKTVEKPAKKAQKSVDLKSLKKAELLAHAKKNGVKANASMNKAAILKAIKNG
jgi:hypothetical protein